MKAIIIIIIVLLVLFWLYLLCLRCRRGKMDQAYFRQWRYAHRGLHDREKGIPENSMAAFKRAAANAFGAELDVHLMKDGKLAVIHDASLLRTAGADVEIEDLTAEALEQYPLEGTEQRIPLLEEVLPLFTDRAPLIVELKAERGNAEALAAAASRVLKKYKGAYCVESFDPRCLMWAVAERAGYPAGTAERGFHRPRGRAASARRYPVDPGEPAAERADAAGLHRLSVRGPGQSVPAAVPGLLQGAGGQLDRAGQGDYGKGRGGREPGHL